MFLAQIIAALALLALCFAVFGVLGRLAPCNPGRPLFVSRSIGLDLGYCLLGGLYAGALPALVALAAHTASPAAIDTNVAPGPLLLQAAALLVAMDFAQYWLHRAFHSRWLWPFHAIHHSAEDVNWTTTFRTHPVNYLAANTALAALARLAGFSELALLIAGPVLFFSGVFTHANLSWTFGPLKYVVASPVFHRWHHSDDQSERERNFAPMFPVWDLAFGTFHMPAGRRPERYGAQGLPGDLVGQLIHPFRPGVRRGVR